MVEVKSNKYFEYTVSLGQTAWLNVGMAQVSKGDQYNRKIGRNIASGRQYSAGFIISNREDLENGTIVIHLRPISPTPKIKSIVLHINPNWAKPHLIHATI